MNVAERILKGMNYTEGKFDTKGFLSAVVEYFERGAPTSILRVQRRRIYAWEKDNNTGFIELTDDDKRFSAYVATMDSKIAGPPLIIVDESYYTNAIALLSWQGFKTEKIDKITTRISLV